MGGRPNPQSRSFRVTPGTPAPKVPTSVGEPRGRGELRFAKLRLRLEVDVELRAAAQPNLRILELGMVPPLPRDPESFAPPPGPRFFSLHDFF